MFIALITFIITWFIFSALYTWNDNTHNHMVDAAIEMLFSIPVLMLICGVYVVLSPLVFLYNFLKWAFKGVKPSVWESVKYEGMHYKQLKNFIFVYSPKNNSLHKLYVVRLLNETNDTAPTHTEMPKETLDLRLPN